MGKRKTDVFICDDCREEIDTDSDLEWVDQGIGPYEFWGAKGCDSHWVFVTNCCESPTILYIEEELDGTISETPHDTSDYATEPEYG